MPRSFLYLHIGILLAGFTGLFGRLITLHETTIVWYRMLLATICLLPFVGLPRMAWKQVVKISLCGGLLGLHWILFYGSIKLSTVSIGTVCYALVGFFTAFIEPIAFHRRISKAEVFFSCLTVVGLLCIFSFDSRYRFGIIVGTFSSLVAAVYSVINKQMMTNMETSTEAISAKTILFYQMLGGLAVVTVLIPGYLLVFPTAQSVAVLPTGANLVYLFCLSFFCTAILYLFYINSLKSLSAFTVSLSYNLEPIYSIIMAFAFLGEGRELNTSFYMGISLILLGVLLQTLRSTKHLKFQ